MESLTILPAIEGKRYGAVPLGYDRIETVRSEVGALSQLAAAVMGIPVEKLTVQNVGNFVALLNSTADRFASLNEDQVVEALGRMDASTPRAEVIACATAYIRVSPTEST